MLVCISEALMGQGPISAVARPDDLMRAARAARLYYFDDRSKMEIASELGVSRFKVARLLDLARSSGIVTVTITGPGSLDLHLSDRLQDRFGLRYAIVVGTSQDDDTLTRRQLGTVAAKLLTEITTPQDVLGLGWARAVLDMASELRELKVARVVQLTGVLTRPDVEVSSVELVRDAARRAQAEPSVFYAPVIVIAYGVGKVSAAYAALRGGYLQGIVTHTKFAEQLLEFGDDRPPGRRGQSATPRSSWRRSGGPPR